MKVSVIIPCYRQGRYLAQAVDSCLAQTHPDVEVIVVNDGSDDDTDAVAGRYGDRIRYIRRPNGGVSSARNAGIAAATGQYVKFLDADDHLAPEQLAWQLDAVGGRQDGVAVTSARAYVDGKPEDYIDLVPVLRQLLPDMFAMPDIPPHAWFFPIRLVRAVGGFNERFSPAADWDLVTRVGRLRPHLHNDSRVGCYYRLCQGSMSTTSRRGTTLEVAERLIAMHGEFRDGPDRNWFGPELLAAEQATYRRMLIGRFGDNQLEHALLRCVRELRRHARPRYPVGGRKFESLCRVTGYQLAERITVLYIRLSRLLAGSKLTRPTGPITNGAGVE